MYLLHRPLHLEPFGSFLLPACCGFIAGLTDCFITSLRAVCLVVVFLSLHFIIVLEVSFVNRKFDRLA